jgi:hypothetical protein
MCHWRSLASVIRSPPERTEPLREGGDDVLAEGVACETYGKEAEAPHAALLLRARRERTAAAPPSSVMNTRRLNEPNGIGCPSQDRAQQDIEFGTISPRTRRSLASV